MKMEIFSENKRRLRNSQILTFSRGNNFCKCVFFFFFFLHCNLPIDKPHLHKLRVQGGLFKELSNVDLKKYQ